MENNGYIKFYRKTFDNPVICKDADHLATWIYLLSNATYKEYDVIFNNKRIKLKPRTTYNWKKKNSRKITYK